MDLGAGFAAQAEAEQRFDLLEGAQGTATFQPPSQGSAARLHTPSGQPGAVLLLPEKAPTCRRRHRFLSNGPLTLPSSVRRLNGPQPEHWKSGQRDERPTGRTKDPGHQVCGPQDAGPRWAALSESRVTALYVELVRELEAQVSELRQILASRNDAFALRERRVRELEQENQELRRHVQSLEEQNDALSNRRPGEGGLQLGPKDRGVVVNESNIRFLKSLTGFLETNCNSQLSPVQTCSTPLPFPEPKFSPPEVLASPVLPPRQEPPLPHPPAEGYGSSPEGMLRVSGVTSGFQYWMNTEESGESAPMLPEPCVMWEEALQETLPDGTPAWASPLEGNGRPKLELVPTSGVYITYQQLEDLSQIPPDKPKLMTRRLLDYFFSRETLARSSATGQRIAHNNTTMEKPLRLPVTVVTAIKEYVTRACGRGCNFNAVINSKCGTSRRAVKKMSIRIDWNGGGGPHCPRTTVAGAEDVISL
ncbi:uncharacterized protein LOC142474873 [Ascaphus truei]|uniref:uncharacterized protein LOC142474873 n=1 Tax=Ascaphus truei TaxID=8439 RepID=UPI003F594F4C